MEARSAPFSAICKRTSKPKWSDEELSGAAMEVGRKLGKGGLTLEALPPLTDELRWNCLEDRLNLTFMELCLLRSIRKYDGKLIRTCPPGFIY
jgi:hypothetical protein